MSLADGNFDEQALKETLDQILASGVKVAFRPNVWYWASSDPADGIRFAEIQDADIWVKPEDV